ncbi:hypothetical protein [Enterococcus asini]|nr:hypothetical protein [Enterococcus asini]
MKQFYVQYLNANNKLCGEYIFANTKEEATKNAKNIQGLSRVIDIKEIDK